MKTTFKYLLAMAVGAAGAMFLDPVRGKARRARLVDQAGARGRRLRDQAQKRARYEAGRVRGMAHELVHDEEVPADDVALLHKVKSEVLGPAGASGLEVDVDNGTVTLIGELPDGDLLRRVRGVTGVADVRVRTSRRA